MRLTEEFPELFGSQDQNVDGEKSKSDFDDFRSFSDEQPQYFDEENSTLTSDFDDSGSLYTPPPGCSDTGPRSADPVSDAVELCIGTPRPMRGLNPVLGTTLHQSEAKDSGSRQPIGGQNPGDVMTLHQSESEDSGSLDTLSAVVEMCIGSENIDIADPMEQEQLTDSNPGVLNQMLSDIGVDISEAGKSMVLPGYSDPLTTSPGHLMTPGTLTTPPSHLMTPGTLTTSPSHLMTPGASSSHLLEISEERKSMVPPGHSDPLTTSPSHLMTPGASSSSHLLEISEARKSMVPPTHSDPLTTSSNHQMTPGANYSPVSSKSSEYIVTDTTSNVSSSVSFPASPNSPEYSHLLRNDKHMVTDTASKVSLSASPVSTPSGLSHQYYHNVGDPLTNVKQEQAPGYHRNVPSEFQTSNRSMAAFAPSSTSSSYHLRSSPMPGSNNFYSSIPSTFYPPASSFFNQGWVYPYQGGYHQHQNPSMAAPAVQGYQEYSNTSALNNISDSNTTSVLNHPSVFNHPSSVLNNVSAHSNAFVLNNPSSFNNYSAHNNTFNIIVNNTTDNSSFSFPGPVQQQYSAAQYRCTEPVVQHALKDSGAPPPVDEQSKPESKWKKKIRRNKFKCVVCTAKSSGWHYDVQCCEGCKGFFRRSIKENIKYKCKLGDACTVDPDNRKRCQACRMKKCMATGMNPACVQKEKKSGGGKEGGGGGGEGEGEGGAGAGVVQ